MTDREKVIRGLQEIHDEAYDRWVHTQYETDRLVTLVSEVVPNALILLKEQEPVKPVVDTRDGWYRCGKCGNSLASGERVRSFGSYKWPVYCEKCGRKVDWDA